VLTAFFLEATFLGIMLFGMNRVPGLGARAFHLHGGLRHHALGVLDPRAHSWMHTPTGHVTQGTVLIAGSWLEVIFNPSFPYRFVHMLLASASPPRSWSPGSRRGRLLKAAQDPGARVTLRLAVRIAAVLVPLQIVAGDMHGLNTLKHQPAKIAALEAIWSTERACR